MTIWITKDQCDGCRRCQRVCPYGGIDVKEGVAVVTDRCTSCGACVTVCKNKAITSDIVPRQVPDFSQYQDIWVFIEQEAGCIARVSLELLGKARQLASATDTRVCAVLMGKDVSGLCLELGQYGAHQIYLAEHDQLEPYRTIAYTNVLDILIRRYKPDVLLMGATPLGRDLAPRVSCRVHAGLTADCTELTIEPDPDHPDTRILWQTRPAFGGNVMATIANRFSRPQMATVRPGVMEAQTVQGADPTIIPVPVDLDPAAILTRVEKTVKEARKGTDITQATVIVAGGRGVDGPKGFEDLKTLASLLGGEVACTRIIVEQGLMPLETQVGQTGQTVRPEIYIACGISGAIQHRAGMMGARYIIAINKDPKAPIFQVANWGIVGDVNEIVPQMIQQLSKGGTL